MGHIDVMDPDDDEDPDDEDPEEAHSLGQVPAVPTPSTRLTPVKARELATQMWEEYGSGLNQRQIGELHGMSSRMVHYHLRRYTRKYGRREIDRARRMDLDRIESAMDAIWEHAIKGNPDKIKLLLTMIKLRADILGYAAPKKIEHSGETRVGVTPELVGLVKEIQARNQTARVDLVRVTSGELETDVVEGEIVDSDDQ